MTDQRARPASTVSRQRALVLRRHKAGQCEDCGKPAPPSKRSKWGFANKCDDCRVKHSKRARLEAQIKALASELAAERSARERAEDRLLAIECFLECAQVKFDEFDEPVFNAEDLDLQITMGWRQHCTSGELRDGKPRQDYLDYGMGFKDGYAAVKMRQGRGE